MKKRLIIIGLSLIAIIAVGFLIFQSNKTDINAKAAEYRAHNYAIENSPRYKEVIDDVMREVYTTYAQNQIDDLESCPEFLDSEQKQKIEKAKELISSDPEKAAELFMMLGSCHELWYLQKKILKEKYDIIWYTPTECHPDIIFD